MRVSGPSDSDILDYYFDVLYQLSQDKKTIWCEFRTVRHLNFQCLFFDGSEEGLIN